MPKNKIIMPNITFLLSSLIVTVLLLTVDIVSDYFKWYGIHHIILEVVITLVLMILITYLAFMLISSRKEAEELEYKISHWKEQHKTVSKGVSKTINIQFNHWNLTNSQKQIGLFILKGLCFKEISDLRKTSERTVRKQAAEIYKKANLKGRHEFAAFFLEDLLFP